MKVGNFHLTYCSNIHPGEHWTEVFALLKTTLPELKNKISPDQPFGVGLRLSNISSIELLENNLLTEFKTWLNKNGLYVFTMNGFSYGDFHGETVKDAVHHPDWTTSARLNYTLRLFRILAELLPEGTEGGISTSPISYKPWFKGNPQRKKTVFEEATLHMVLLVEELHKIQQESGKTMHLDIEPEPDGLLENTQEVIRFFSDWLFACGAEALTGALKIPVKEAKEIISEHIKICYDICHFALAYEAPVFVFDRLKKAGIGIGKIQISAALKVELLQQEKRKKIFEELLPFNESTYLHQVVERRKNQDLNHYEDLPAALQNIYNAEAMEWRIHFHVPVFIKQYNNLQSTQEEIVQVLEILKKETKTHHLEVETYTWEVLPPEIQIELVPSIQRELEWVLEHLQ